MAAAHDIPCPLENASLQTGAQPCNRSTVRTSPYSPQATAAIAVVITFMMMVTIVGNILVIIAVLTSRSLKGAQNLFLVSLAAADILVATLIIPFSLANELQGYWAFSSIWCEIYLALDVLFCTSSIVHLCAIAMDRYLSISRPVSYGTKRTPVRIKVAIVIVWLISAVISFPPLLTVDKLEGGGQCELNNERWYILYSTIGSFFAPCVIMILVYIRIYQIAKQHTRCPPGQKPKVAGGVAPGPPAVRSPDQKKESQEGSASRRRGKVFTPTSPSESNQSSLRKPAETTTAQKASSDVPWEGPVIPVLPVLPAEHLDPEEEMNPDNMSGSGSEAELEISDGGVGADICQENGKKLDEGVQGLSRNDGDKVQVLDQACRYKNTMSTPSGTRLAPEDTAKSQGTPVARRKAMANREKRFTFVLAVVMGVFVICWFPFFLSYSLMAVCPQTCTTPESLFKFFFWIGYCNSCLNPVIYTIFNKDFRRAFKKILSRDTKGTFF